jgi:dCMP deaminase
MRIWQNNKNRNSMNRWDEYFFDLAKRAARQSKDPSTKVGSVITRPNRSICSIGFNGFPMGVEDTPERLNNRELKYPRVMHAERNAMAFATEVLQGYTLYNYPFQPCSICAGEIIQRGIRTVISIKSDNPRWIDDFKIAQEMFNEASVLLILLDDDATEIEASKNSTGNSAGTG